jgi:cell division protein FtsB
MKQIKKNVLEKTGVCIISALIPLLLILDAMQTRRYDDLASEVSNLEQKQEQLVESNKTLVSNISLLSSADRVEKMASGVLGMHKAESGDIVRIEMTGRKK